MVEGAVEPERGDPERRQGELMARAADPALAEAYAALERLLPKPLARYERTLDELNTALEQALAELAPDTADARA